MNRPKKITVQEAARLMGVSDRFVYEGMKRGALPIGYAMQMPGSTKWSFYISPPKLAAYIGADIRG